MSYKPRNTESPFEFKFEDLSIESKLQVEILFKSFINSFAETTYQEIAPKYSGKKKIGKNQLLKDRGAVSRVIKCPSEYTESTVYHAYGISKGF